MQTLEYDEKYNAKYWFNTLTGESEWLVNDDILSADDAAFNSFMHEDDAMEKHKLIHTERNETSKHPNQTKEIELVPLSDSINSHNDMSSLILEINDEFLPTEVNFTDRDIIYFNICTVFHVIVFEAVLLLLESLLRCIACFSLFLISIIPWCCISRMIQKCFYKPSEYLREAIICFAAFISCLLPFTVVQIYREVFCCKQEFDVKPFLTICGWVDSRRFLVICFGSGSVANNTNWDRDISSASYDSWKGQFIFTPRDVRKLFNMRAGG